jgi:transcriptional regulator with XRE-family HTH domain
MRPALPVVVAANVRFERLSKGISQESLARRADLSRETIRRIEAGRLEDGYSMTLLTLGAIADGLGLEASELLKWKKEATRAYLHGVTLVSPGLAVVELAGGPPSRKRLPRTTQLPLMNVVLPASSARSPEVR